MNNSLSLQKHSSFSGRKGPVVVLVADGVGVAPAGPSNAVSEANTPTLDYLSEQTLYTQLLAHGTAVGLPCDDDMGNSEVGHNAIGAGVYLRRVLSWLIMRLPAVKHLKPVLGKPQLSTARAIPCT